MERILVVDDEASIRKALQMGLADERFVIDAACDGRSGIQMGHAKTYDILIADLCLPDMTGLEVIQNIKVSNPAIVPIVITGKGSMASSLEAIRLEVSDYIEKPLSLDSIKESIARALERRSQKFDFAKALLRQQFFTDPLTGLPGRTQFMQRVAQTLADQHREEGALIAVLLVDVDGFKNVNDSYGSAIGDKVLIELARRLEACCPNASNLARLDGDTFALLIEDAPDDDRVTVVARSCQHAAQQPVSAGGPTITPAVSIGIVSKRTGFTSTDDMLRDAEMALGCAKRKGGGQIQIFDPCMLEREVASLQFENALRMGLPNNEFILHYQPIIKAKSLQLCGFEALIRWNHPERGLLYPMDFIPMAEDIGIINKIGQWVLDEACRQLKVWQERFTGQKKIALNVNIAGCHFLQPGFLDCLQDLIAANDLDPSMLVLELTESLIMEDSHRSIEVIQAIKNMGIQLAVDDFGTGYSAFSYLQQLPLDQLKIGEYFVRKLAVSAECYEIVRTIVDLSKRLNLSVIAEGIENAQQLGRIQALDIDMVQGFFFSRPITRDETLKVAHEFL